MAGGGKIARTFGSMVGKLRVARASRYSAKLSRKHGGLLSVAHLGGRQGKKLRKLLQAAGKKSPGLR